MPKSTRTRSKPATAAAATTAVRLGYPCINLQLSLTTSRTIRLASISDAEKLRSVIDANIAAARAIIDWNAERSIGLFRLGSQFIPFASHPEFPYNWQEEHGPALRALGRAARKAGIRLSMHPGQYVCPGSPRPDVVDRSLAELRYAAAVMDLIGSPDGVIVIHLGGAYGDRPAAMSRFVSALQPEPAILRYLALENDEITWSPAEALSAAAALGTAAIIDNLHWRLNPGSMTLAQAVREAKPTWGRRRPKLHLSSQDSAKLRGAHAPFIDPADFTQLVEAAAGDTDIMIEAKAKEQAVFALRGEPFQPLTTAAE